MSSMHHFGESEEMYLKIIAELGGGDQLVPVTGIAEKLGISTVSASEMVRRMQARELVVHTPYKGVRLTEPGLRRANGVIRRHRLWERFLIDRLRLPWDRAYEYACRLEHAADEELTEALGDFLGNPSTCPHGNPIPTPEGTTPDAEGEPLSMLAAGEAGTILRIADVNRTVLAYLDERQINPGEQVKVHDIAPLDGPMTISVGDVEHVLGREVAAHILVDMR